MQHIYFGDWSLICKTQKDDIFVGQPIPIDLLSKVLVVGDENPVLCKGSLDHLLIDHSYCLLIHGDHIVLSIPEPASHGRASALIDEKTYEDLLQAKRHEICILYRPCGK